MLLINVMSKSKKTFEKKKFPQHDVKIVKYLLIIRFIRTNIILFCLFSYINGVKRDMINNVPR